MQTYSLAGVGKSPLSGNVEKCGGPFRIYDRVSSGTEKRIDSHTHRLKPIGGGKIQGAD